MAQKEKRYQTRVINYLKLHGYYTMNVTPDGVSVKAGTPDVIACIEGIYCGIELKAGKKYKATNRQIIHLKEIRKAGGVGIVLIDGPDWKTELDEIIRHCTIKNIRHVNNTYPLPEVKW